MDLVIGHAKGPDGFSTCVFSENYNQAIESKRKFTSMTGDKIQVLAIFLGKGSNAPDIHASLQEHIKCNIVGWYDASPGQITDTVHHILAPASLANNFARSVDKFIAPVVNQINVSATKPVSASKPDATTSNKPDGGKKTGVRPRKPR